jgi:hypothetical protein
MGSFLDICFMLLPSPRGHLEGYECAVKPWMDREDGLEEKKRAKARRIISFWLSARSILICSANVNLPLESHSSLFQCLNVSPGRGIISEVPTNSRRVQTKNRLKSRLLEVCIGIRGNPGALLSLPSPEHLTCTAVVL